MRWFECRLYAIVDVAMILERGRRERPGYGGRERRASSVRWERMTEDDREEFGEWLTWIGYRPGLADYGRSASRSSST
jgi:hypothetical protein